ncbi:nucleoside triphosphate pyrophosphohydrolase [Acidaminobacter sp. JC074]|uniref:nucleoside triphosphate pyrophosphohydrolase n=1 Tax=Acidaminobacter sp. JC074 TaxID=2530199 RepID=UPI001F10C7DF|nr:nucleoside triphosphate pyrophosphohydrolase [Acidaminobacter sp. JC074]MCH4890678.1 nucleoside triphosphate pyrophosphohydrolase [Acidaminobacter sp. JC074]
MNQLTIIGLGPGSKSYLTLEAVEAIKASDLVYVRTMKHPVMTYLESIGGKFESFDDFYESYDNFDDVYENIGKAVLDKLSEGDVVYAVPGNPFVAESTVEYLIDHVDEEYIKVIHGASFIDAIVTTLRMDPVYGLQIIDGLTIEEKVPDVTSDALIIQVYDSQVASNVKLQLMNYYHDDHEVVVVRGAGIEGEEEIVRVPLYELDRVDCLDHLTSVYIEAIHPEDREKFFMPDLVQVMKALRSPDGCPWDREQTHESLRRYIIEEAYEVVEAIDDEDLWGLEEELGDLLLQVVFHAEIAAENGYFNFNDVVTGIYEKMVRRHPHVFADIDVENSDEVLVNWEAIKNEEKSEKTVSDSISNIAKSFPPILRAEKIQKKMAKVGFDWPDYTGALKKVREELHELDEAIKSGDLDHAGSELGDLLFAVVNVARILKLDPSDALVRTNNKVVKRFSYVESSLLDQGKSLEEESLEAMDELWEKSKTFE